MNSVQSRVPKDKLLNIDNLKNYFNKVFTLNITG